MKKILVKLKEFWQRKTISAAILRILIILLTLLVTGYFITTPFMLRELGLIGVPSTVKEAYVDARTQFTGEVLQRVGVRRCVKNTEQLYVVFLVNRFCWSV
jgi:Ni,Fe-hydrogenase I cytochrome b subunit